MDEILFDEDLKFKDFLNLCNLFITRNPESANMNINVILADRYKVDLKGFKIKDNIVELEIYD